MTDCLRSNGQTGSQHLKQRLRSSYIWVIGGQVAISDHVRIEDRVMIGSQSGVPKSLSKGQVVSGTPAMPHRIWLKTRGLITRLPQFYDRLRGLEKKVDEMERRLK